jgi:hypothetical protein
MSSSQYQRNVNSLDKEIADLEKKKAQNENDVAKLQKKIADAQKDISRTKSASTRASKAKQIDGWTGDLAKKQSSVAEYGKKIADKRSKRNSEYQKLQRALADEQKTLQKSYERTIESLTQKINVSDITSRVEEQNNYQADEEYDVFISHAWEDKEDFADEFVMALEQLGIRVWYDTKKLQWGDSMRSKIDDGLRKSKFGIAILSPNYIAEGKYWTKEEFNGLFQLESINGKKILPIWHNLTKNQVMKFSPMIADKKAMTTANMTIEEIAQTLKKLLDSMKKEQAD